MGIDYRRRTARHERYRPTPSRSQTTLRGASHFGFRPDVEGLRGIAILLVVAYHVGIAPLGGGYVGVDVFFVLSGFLITALLLAEISRTGRIDFAAFYARRVKRLFPAAAVTIVGTLAIAAFLYPPHRLISVAAAAQAMAGFGSNIYFAHQARDYFSATSQSPLLHAWSLSLEEQFYLVWPLLVLLGAGRRANRERLTVTLAVVVIASLLACWYWTLIERPTAFYGMPTRAWEFAIGATVALLPGTKTTEHLRIAPRLSVVTGWCGMAMIVGASVAFSNQTAFPGVAAALPVAGTAFLLGVGASGTGASVGRLLSSPALQWMGRHSYAWYLWHWPFLVLGAELIPHATTGVRLACALAGLGAAIITHVAIENPVRQSMALGRRPRLVLAGGMASIALLLLCGAAVRLRATRVTNEAAYRAIRTAIADAPALFDTDCFADFADTTAHACELGVLTGARGTVVAFGDSHVAHWVPAIEDIAVERRWRLVVFTKRGCPSIETTVYEPLYQRQYVECDAWRRATLDSLRAHPPALVVLSNSAEYVRGDPRARPRAVIAPEEYERGLAATLATLRALHVQTVVIQDVPTPPENVPLCLERSLWRGRSAHNCDFRASDGENEGARRATVAAVALVAGARLADLSGALCPSGLCMAERDGVIAYRDDNHLTAHQARRLGPALAAALDSAGLGALPR